MISVSHSLSIFIFQNQQHTLEYKDENSTLENRYYFERDTADWYWCRDKSCAISTAIYNHEHTYNTPKQCTNPHDSYVAPNESAFYVGSNFITEDKAPEAIPCGLMLFDQSHYGGDGIACEQGENWKETKRNKNSMNWVNADFEPPSYQSNACCSSIARMGFGGKYMYV